ncbi:hypothetical protein ANN_11036 [Periplaneta americana]|uniref:Uncharacterized protein n=1 Tax=Periplaneta americana TaxID=6978 RepID=A0ABQ8T5N0_PERAM|nr:hypothetical protein ANN_11036 [Periplaneta americana]
MNPGSSTESYPAFARIGLRENPGKNLNQVTCPDQDMNPGHLVSQPDVLTVTPQLPPREVRSVIKFLNAKGIAQIEIGRQLCQVYGQADEEEAEEKTKREKPEKTTRARFVRSKFLHDPDGDRTGIITVKSREAKPSPRARMSYESDDDDDDDDDGDDDDASYSNYLKTEDTLGI